MNALESLANGSLAGKRNQTVLSPPEILDPLRESWGGKILFDPCPAPIGPIRVGDTWQFDIVNATYAARNMDGLARRWLPFAFCNPPYAELQQWLDLDRAENPTCWLVPVRSHRSWWRDWAKQVEIFYLNPVKFLGFDQSFPAPLCLGFYGAVNKDFWEDTGLGDWL